MSTPPFVALPHGVEKIRYTGTYSSLAGLISYPPKPSTGTVLLVPGFTGSKEDFIALYPLLAQRGYTVVGFDQRGQYESPGPDSDAGYSLDDFGSDVLAVLSQLPRDDEPVHLVGHSFGGLVARRTVALLPAAHARLNSLTLLSSGPAAIPSQLGELASQLADLLPATPLDHLWELKEEQDSGDARVPATDAVSQFLHHRFVSNNPYALKAKASILVTEGDHTADLALQLGKSRLPALVAYGLSDDRWPPALQEAMAHRLRARVATLAGVGHSPAAEAPTATAIILDAFFQDVAGSRIRHTAFEADSVGYPSTMQLRIPLTRDPAEVGRIRKSMTRLLTAAGCEAALDDFQIVVSELVTNAVRYGNEPVDAVLDIEASRLRLSVTDTNVDDAPIAGEPSQTEPNGRGLHLVAALSRQWGVEKTDHTKTVWAELPLRVA